MSMKTRNLGAEKERGGWETEKRRAGGDKHRTDRNTRANRRTNKQTDNKQLD